MLRIAESLLKQGGREPDAAQPAAPVAEEVEAPSIVRPEQIIHSAVSGFAVPTTISTDFGLESRWEHYLQWADGRREKRGCGPTIVLPDKTKLWVHPGSPSNPPITNNPAWSRKARAAWLAGAASPEPEDVFRRLCQRLSHFIDLPGSRGPGITATVALWIILTHCYLVWDAVPYLYVGGPLGSGKSRLFEVLFRLMFRPLASSNMTAAALFRTLHAQGGTLLLDEAERLRSTQSPDVHEILSMLLAGYKRGGTATRLEAAGDTYKTVSFDVYGPKALACIAGLPPALASRAETIPGNRRWRSANRAGNGLGDLGRLPGRLTGLAF